MTLPSRQHSIYNSSPDGPSPSTLPLSHGGSPQYWIFTSERGRNIVFLWNLKARVGFEPEILNCWHYGHTGNMSYSLLKERWTHTVFKTRNNQCTVNIQVQAVDWLAVVPTGLSILLTARLAAPEVADRSATSGVAILAWKDGDVLLHLANRLC